MGQQSSTPTEKIDGIVSELQSFQKYLIDPEYSFIIQNSSQTHVISPDVTNEALNFVIKCVQDSALKDEQIEELKEELEKEQTVHLQTMCQFSDMDPLFPKLLLEEKARLGRVTHEGLVEKLKQQASDAVRQLDIAKCSMGDDTYLLVDELKHANYTIRVNETENKEKMKVLRRKYDLEIDAAELRIQEREKKIKVLNSKVAVSNRKLNKEIEEHKSLKTNLERTENKLKETEDKLTALEGGLDTKGYIDKLKEEISMYQNRIVINSVAINQLNKNDDESKLKIHKMERELDEKTKTLSKQEKMLDMTNDEWLKTLQELEDLKEDLNARNIMIDKITEEQTEEINKIMEKCKMEVMEKNRKIAELEEKLPAELYNEKQELAKKLEKSDAMYEKMFLEYEAVKHKLTVSSGNVKPTVEEEECIDTNIRLRNILFDSNRTNGILMDKNREYSVKIKDLEEKLAKKEKTPAELVKENQDLNAKLEEFELMYEKALYDYESVKHTLAVRCGHAKPTEETDGKRTYMDPMLVIELQSLHETIRHLRGQISDLKQKNQKLIDENKEYKKAEKVEEVRTQFAEMEVAPQTAHGQKRGNDDQSECPVERKMRADEQLEGGSHEGDSSGSEDSDWSHFDSDDIHE